MSSGAPMKALFYAGSENLARSPDSKGPPKWALAADCRLHCPTLHRRAAAPPHRRLGRRERGGELRREPLCRIDVYEAPAAGSTQMAEVAWRRQGHGQGGRLFSAFFCSWKQIESKKDDSCALNHKRELRIDFKQKHSRKRFLCCTRPLARTLQVPSGK
jgi:hypothetical protein